MKRDQVDVHGLLGQNAVYAPSQQPAHGAAPGGRSGGERDRDGEDNRGGNGGGGERKEHVRAGGPSMDSFGARTSHVEVSHQGEGSILGHYSEYLVPSLAEHNGFRFSRFACAPGGDSSQSPSDANAATHPAATIPVAAATSSAAVGEKWTNAAANAEAKVHLVDWYMAAPLNIISAHVLGVKSQVAVEPV